MHAGIVPVRSAEGRDELAMRTRRPGPCCRRVVLHVDGQRSAGEIVVLAQRAGAQGSADRELIGLGVIAAPAGANRTDAAPRRSEPVAPLRRSEPAVRLLARWEQLERP
jgi:hypothetical protein